jgi:hypothetical protein
VPGTVASLMMTTRARERTASVTFETGVTLTSNCGGEPTASAEDKYRLSDNAAPSRTITRTGVGRAGDSTKWKTLSMASASVPAFTVPRTNACASVNAGNETAFVTPGVSVARDVAVSSPSIDRTTATFSTACAPRLATAAVTITRSSFANRVRLNVTDVTDTFAGSEAATDTGVNVVPSGN